MCEAKNVHLGNVSASSRTTSTPSRANAAAAKDPPGPAPMTKTEHEVGVSMAFGLISRAKRLSWEQVYICTQQWVVSRLYCWGVVWYL